MLITLAIFFIKYFNKMSNRDTSRYILKNGNRIEYIGITNDPERRMNEHSRDKSFTTMEIVGPKVKRATAEKWETERIETYANNHNGSAPPLNKTKNGK